MVIVYVPGGVLWKVLTVRVAVPDPPDVSETLLELKVSLGLLDEQTAERDTVPVKPAMLARLMVMVPELPAARLREAGVADRLKSWTLTVIVTECVDEPLVPVTVTV